MSNTQIADPDALWEFMENFNQAGADTAIPVLDRNGIFWMAYMHEDDCEVMGVGLESGDPRDRITGWSTGDLHYDRVNADQVVYPLTVLWQPEVAKRSCAGKVGVRPDWMGADQWDGPCPCILIAGHDGVCRCDHMTS